MGYSFETGDHCVAFFFSIISRVALSLHGNEMETTLKFSALKQYVMADSLPVCGGRTMINLMQAGIKTQISVVPAMVSKTKASGNGFLRWFTGASAFLCLGMAFLQASAITTAAQDTNSRPARSVEAVEALRQSSWEELETGLASLKANTALGTQVLALKISPEHFRFSIEQQATPKGERASSVAERTGGIIAFNGGFFGQKGQGDLYPVGMLIDDGKAVSSAWSNIGGFLALREDGRPEITLSRAGAPEWALEAVQSKPVLIETGGLWAMRTNGTELERRSLICILPDNNVVFMIISGGGLTLFEAGWLMRSPKWGGYFDCDRAIALDGGGSTQLKVRDHSQLDVSGVTGVQNLLVVHRRSQQ